MCDNKRETRTKRMKVHLTPQEHEWIKEKMAQAGMTNMSEFIRRMAMNGYVINADQPELDEILRLLRYMGNNINQLTQRVHETARIYDEDLADIRKKQDEICEGVRGILSQLSKLSEA